LKNLRNIKPNKLEKILITLGWKQKGQRGSHKHFHKKGEEFIITLTSSNPLSIGVVKRIINILKLSNKEFLELLENKKNLKGKNRKTSGKEKVPQK
jgi:predicted RNA binding protein YcfA (HicA-like mRNA interferase family)